MSWQFRGRPAIVEDMLAARRAQPASEPTPAAEIAPRAPWVPVSSAVKHPAAETERHKTAFKRDWHCEVCAYRYSRCYPFNHGGRRA